MFNPPKLVLCFDVSFSVSFHFIAVMSGALSPWRGTSSVCRWRSWPADVREAVNILYK